MLGLPQQRSSSIPLPVCRLCSSRPRLLISLDRLKRPVTPTSNVPRLLGREAQGPWGGGKRDAGAGRSLSQMDFLSERRSGRCWPIWGRDPVVEWPLKWGGDEGRGWGGRLDAALVNKVFESSGCRGLYASCTYTNPCSVSVLINAAPHRLGTPDTKVLLPCQVAQHLVCARMQVPGGGAAMSGSLPDLRRAGGRSGDLLQALGRLLRLGWLGLDSRAGIDTGSSCNAGAVQARAFLSVELCHRLS
jgi:hypothetical protein